LLETPARDERQRGGRDAAIAVARRDAVAELNRVMLARAQEEHADHRVRSSFGDDQGP
jgi:hypothetical protein